MINHQFTEELSPMYETFSSPQSRGCASISFQEERRRMDRTRARTIQASMRQSQWQRMFWSKLILCWFSAALVLLVFVWHSTSMAAPKPNAAKEIHIAGVTWGTPGGDHHSMLRNSDNNNNGDLSHFSRVFLSKQLISPPGEQQQKQTTSVQSQMGYVAPPYSIHTNSRAHERQRLQSQYATFEEPQPSSDDSDDEDGGDADPTLGSYHPQSLEAPGSLAARQQQQQHPIQKNPAIYGWTPAAFPNPINNPIRCAIAYLPQFMNHPTGGVAEQHDNGERTPPSGTLIQQQQSGGNQHPLRLCDPDWVLGGMYLEQVAVAMNNFTKMFGREHYEQVMRQQEAATLAGTHLPVSPAGKDGAATWVDLAVATARKMDLTAVLRDSTYYAYEDDDDMVNDAAQQFAHGLHAAWWPSTATPNEDGEMPVFDEGLMEAEHGILIFLSVQDRVCFISTGPAISAILPWWRVDHVVTAMKPALRERDYGTALLQALSHLSVMLRSGPPSMTDRLNDFTARFGVVILFAGFTFFFGAWGEYRDRRKRYQFAEERSQLKGVDREKACLLQQGYKTTQCPICLESFVSDKAAILGDHIADSCRTSSDDGDEDNDVKTVLSDTDSLMEAQNKNPENKLDSYGIPLLGPDGNRIKMLRCGHIFCESCWKSWVNSGCGNPCICPVCRQDIGKAPKHSCRRLTQPGGAATSRQPSQMSRTAPVAAVSGSPDSDVTTAAQRGWETHPSYDSVSQSRRSSTNNMPANNLNSSGLNSVDGGFDVDDEDASIASGERRPLLSRHSS